MHSHDNTVRVALVIVGERLRPLNREAVESLVESIKIGRLLHPIIITRDLELVDGYHRLEAFKKSGKPEIPCSYFDGTPEEARLAECDANLVRNELTALERMQHLEIRKELREAMLKPLRPKVKDYLEPYENIPSDDLGASDEYQQSSSSLTSFDPDEAPLDIAFTREASALTGLSQRTIQKDLHTVGALTEEVQVLLDDTAISNSKQQLQALAALPAHRQVEVAKQAIDEHKTVQAVLGQGATKKITALKPHSESHKKSDAQIVQSLRERIESLCPACQTILKEILH